MISNFLVQHNLPISIAFHLGPLFKNVFPDSKNTSSYSLTGTKTTTTQIETFASHYQEFVVGHCQSHLVSCGTDGSSDTGIQKMNPVTTCLFDINASIKKVTSHFYKICLSDGVHGAKVKTIFKAIDE